MALILVTGSTGFIGRYLAPRLEEDGHTVVGLTTQKCDGENVVCDLTSPEDVAAVVKTIDPDVIVHLAALSSVTLGMTLDYYRTNVVGTENLFRAMDALNRKRRVIVVSTAGVYGNQPHEILTEELRPLPVSHYGISKYASERVAATFGARQDITIVRPFNIIGAGQNGSFIAPKLVDHFARRASTIRLGNLDPVRDYIDVDTCCDILCRLIEQPAAIGATVNLCSGKGISVRQLLAAISEVSGHDIEPIAAKEFMRANEVFRLLGSTALLDQLVPVRMPVRPVKEVLGEMLSIESQKLELAAKREKILASPANAAVI
ncbi:NAD-dependent epimerase/dehydratase family protein [Paraburkholderia bryophila]|uniref:Nucleoside-diphosphate-sugar epimerase n=1 Tax=Paraburkholderia bryophila TaxID=420952 RepID=A0A7Z0BAB6_9BURK|nr:NAD(P)-dependent oxidoreductase [Paraburkholderia bryophila]NYH27621.1 nucleoside-diphosphate-sugar epimerase [Paraburkholderia bryophila]